ncbi:MAG: zinc ABC transporter substrate-binding protein, partial [Acidimicrobiia bacterium]
LVIVLGGGFQPAVEKLAERRRGTTITVLTGRVADPHIWLDPRAMAALALRVQEGLARLDPDGRREFAANATAYRDRLLALDREFAAGLANCERRVIVTSHAAFGVLARRYGLRQEALAGIQPEAEPDPARLDALVQLVRREKVTTVFTEPLVSKRLVATLAREAGVRIAVLDPIESLPAGADYVSVMRKNLATLRAALGCR